MSGAERRELVRSGGSATLGQWWEWERARVSERDKFPKSGMVVVEFDELEKEEEE